jgi:hypothetical protein
MLRCACGEEEPGEEEEQQCAVEEQGGEECHCEEEQRGEEECHTPVLKSTEPKPPYVCPGCLITCIATI